MLVGCGGDQPVPPKPAAKSNGSDDRDATQSNALGRRELPQVRRMLDKLVAGVNGRDPSICTQVYSSAYRAQLMGKRGTAALAACRNEVKRAEIQAAIVRIERAQLTLSARGVPKGSVQVLERIGTRSLLRVTFGVTRAPGGYRIASAKGSEVTPAEARAAS
jgi:hypothetical protein